MRTLRAVRDDGVDAVLVLVGDGEDRPDVEELARDLGVAEHCRLVGFQQRIREWYAAADVSLLTSANEGTPVVAIESLAAERPVVATRAGGTATVVTDGESGYLLPVGDTAGLAPARSRARPRPEAARSPRPQRRRRRPHAFRHRPDGRRARRRLSATARVKVLHLHKLTGVSGSEGHLLVLLPALRAAGIDARFLGLDVPGSDAPRFYERLDALGVPSPQRSLRLRRQPADGAGRRSGRCGRSSPDLLHTHLVHADVYGALAARATRTPYLSTRHNDDRYLLGPFRYVDRAFARGARRLIAISEAVRTFLEAAGHDPQQARDDPLRARRARAARRPSRRPSRPGSRRARRSHSPSAD